MEEYYFTRFEHRTPYTPVRDSGIRTVIFQVSGTLSVLVGLVYLTWRWTSTINFESPVFSFTLLFAETFSFVGICLFVFELWKSKDAPRQAPPRFLSDIEDLGGRPDRPIRIDVFIATVNEEAGLLRYTIRDAKKLTYPCPDVKIKIYVLDDGRRDGRDPSKENLRQLCAEEGVTYLTRETNEGFKAGNLRNGLRHSNGDLFVILDADCRPFQKFLENTTGYFRGKGVAWVQTCHWFYDTTSAIPLSEYLIRTFGVRSASLQRFLRFCTRNIKTGEDIFGSDPRQFYEVILRKRNFHNAAFCCGAGSVHRREAVMDSALRLFIQDSRRKSTSWFGARLPRQDHDLQLVRQSEIIPFVYHASEDLYTSMVIQSDPNKRWESVLHPYVECKLLSPQDIGSFVKQRRRYAEGSIDIFIHDNPLFKKGLGWRQRLCYFHSVWAYFSCLWIMLFLLSPVIYFFFGTLPVSCSTSDFLTLFIPFFVFTRIADAAGSWGVSQKRGKQYYISLFWVNFLSIIRVLSGKKIKFNVTPKSKQAAQSLRHAWPHMLLIVLTLTGIVMRAEWVSEEERRLGYLLNTFWGLINCYNLNVFVRAAFWNTEVMEPARAEHTATTETILPEINLN